MIGKMIERNNSTFPAKLKFLLFEKKILKKLDLELYICVTTQQHLFRHWESSFANLSFNSALSIPPLSTPSTSFWRENIRISDATLNNTLGRFVNDSPDKYANCRIKKEIIDGVPKICLQWTEFKTWFKTCFLLYFPKRIILHILECCTLLLNMDLSLQKYTA